MVMMAMVDNRALPTASSVPLHQQEVDRIQAEIRADLLAGRRSLFKPAQAGPRPSDDVLDERIAQELELAIRQLEQIGDLLAEDPILLQRHAMQLQSIDLL